MGGRQKPRDSYRHIPLTSPTNSSLTSGLSSEQSASSMGLSRHPNDTLLRPRSEPTSPKIGHSSLLRSSTISSGREGQRQQIPLATIGRVDAMYPAAQGQRPQSVFSSPGPPLQPLPPPHIPTQWQLPPNRVSGSLRGRRYSHAGKYQSRLPPPTSAPSNTTQVWNPEVTRAQVQDQSLPYQDQSLSYQDQTTLVISVLSHLDRLTRECEDMRAFIRLGLNAQGDGDGLSREIEDIRIQLRNWNTRVTELDEALKPLPLPNGDVPLHAAQTGWQIQKLDHQAIGTLLELYNLPFASTMFLHEKKVLYLRFVGANRTLMHRILD